MDILNPTAPAIPHKEATYGQAAIDDAEKTLSDFKRLAKETVSPEATKLLKAAKDLVKEVHYNCEQSQQKVASKEWSQTELDSSRDNLRIKQEPAWQTLLTKSEELRKQIDGPYKVLLVSKDNITRARGDNVTGALFGALTDDQKQVRKVFDNKLKVSFGEAATAYDQLTSYPDGLLTQIPLLQKKSLDALNVGVTPKESAPQGNLYLAAQEQAK